MFRVGKDNPFGDLKSLSPSENRVVDNGSIIAVSYEARAKGVKRIMRGAEAKKVKTEMTLWKRLKDTVEELCVSHSPSLVSLIVMMLLMVMMILTGL